jgi:hypothetical protein
MSKRDDKPPVSEKAKALFAEWDKDYAARAAEDKQPPAMTRSDGPASDQDRLQQVYRQIRQIKAAEYPAIVGRDSQYQIVERPWQDMPEASKLAILQDAVDWSGITNRDQAHILLAEIDPGKITDSQRNRLIDMATVKLTLKDILEGKSSVADAREQDRDKDRGMER